HFERVSLNARGHGTTQHEADLRVISGRAQYHGWPVPGLLAPSLGVETDPHNVAGFGNVAPRHHQTSFPTGPPKSTSRCTFRRETPLRSSPKSYSFRCNGSITIRPASSRMSTASSSSRSAACKTAAGIRTEALFPHFLTAALIAASSLCLQDARKRESCQHCRYKPGEVVICPAHAFIGTLSQIR